MFNDQLEIEGDQREDVEGFDNLQTEEEIAEYEAWLDDNDVWAAENGTVSVLSDDEAFNELDREYEYNSSFDLSDDGQALASAGHGTYEDYAPGYGNEE